MDSQAKTTLPGRHVNGRVGPEEASRRRQIEAQRALLQLSIRRHEYGTSHDLFDEASRLALRSTEADVAFLYLRQRANPRSERLGESVSFHLVQRFADRGAALPPADAPTTIERLDDIGRREDVCVSSNRTHLFVPFRRHSKVMALLDLYKGADGFDRVDVQMMRDLMELIGSILQTKYLIAARTALVELAQNLSAELNLASLLEKVVRAAADIVYAQASSILLIQPQKEVMRFAAVHGLSEKERELLRQLIVPVQGSMAGSVVLTGKPLVSNDVAKDPQFYAGVSNTLDTKTRSLLAVPLIAGDRPLGALEVINQNYDDPFDQSDIEILTLFASQAAIAIQNARLLAERQASLTELTKLEQRKSQFIALASHELRTPLNLVSGYATLLRGLLDDMHTPPEHEALDFLAQIEQATTRLIGMVNNITSMYNLETGRTQLLLEPKDVIEIVRKVMAEYSEWCHNKGIDLALVPPEGPMVALCDPLEIHRILSNLINNAVKFTPEGGRISVSVHRSPGADGPASGASPHGRQEIVTSVADTGPGIAPAQLDTIFERFAQIGSHLNRAQDGMGLGLPLAKALVEKHGGRLWVDSQPGAGATFHFSLPATA